MQTQDPVVLRWEGEEVLADDKTRPLAPKGSLPRLEDVFPADAVAALRRGQEKK